jgi:hypothetical protein
MPTAVGLLEKRFDLGLERPGERRRRIRHESARMRNIMELL